jgi:hypothetical protein
MSTVSRTEEVIVVNSLAREMGVPVSTAASFRRIYLRELVAQQVFMVPLSSVPQVQRGRMSDPTRVIPFEDSDHATFVREKYLELFGRPVRHKTGALQCARLTERGRELAQRFLEAERRAKQVRGLKVEAE